jgi:hypothetical protein
MSGKTGGAGAGYCDVCERRYSWGCGHSGSQESAARKHNQTRAHAERRCMCYGHDHCDPKMCKLAGKQTPGYLPFHQHTPDPNEIEP